MSTELSEKEKSIIRFYEGDVSGDDPFWSDPKAYLTINSLFFPGIENEIARTNEEKKLNAHFFDDDERTLDVIQTLFTSGLKFRDGKTRQVFRVERYRDYLQMKEKGKTISFTSTSATGFLKQYSDRRGIALLEITVMPHVPCIDMAAELDYYAKKSEQELLLLPGSTLDVKEKPVPEEYMDIIDMDGNPPMLMVEMKITGINEPVMANEEKTFDRAALYRVYDALNSHLTLSLDDINDYIAYKKWLMRRLYERIKKDMQ